MTKWSGVTPNAAPALADYLMGVTAGNVDDRVTIQNLINLISKNMSIPYKASAYLASDQGISAATWTKATLNTKEFDTSSNFDAVTNFRFTAPAAGFYMIIGNAGLSSAGMSTGYAEAAIYKNGVALLTGNREPASGNANAIPRDNMPRFVQLAANDFIELYGYINEGGRSIAGGVASTNMQVWLVTTT